MPFFIECPRLVPKASIVAEAGVCNTIMNQIKYKLFSEKSIFFCPVFPISLHLTGGHSSDESDGLSSFQARGAGLQFFTQPSVSNRWRRGCILFFSFTRA
jgi:hypothetical protein